MSMICNAILDLPPVHEGTLMTALSTLALWCSKFTTEVPTKLTEWFKVGKLYNCID